MRSAVLVAAPRRRYLPATRMYRALRPLLFRLPPDTAHEWAFAALGPVEHSRTLRAAVRATFAAPRDPRVAVRVMGLDFPSPLGIAGGFDKNARRPRALAALGFGHLELGTVTALPQAPNPPPNLFRLPADRALVNRLGFPNEGATTVAARVRRVRSAVGVPIGMSIGKSRAVKVEDLDAVVADYVASMEAVRDVADFVVVNVSSPNTAGLRSMQAGEHARALLSALASRTQGKPLLVKIAPDLDDAGLDALLAVVEEVELAGVVATNTTLSRAGLNTDAARVEAIGAGGLSGPPLRARALEVVSRVRRRLGPHVVVVGVGGIERAEHAMNLVRAGADLVQMYTGFIYEGPGVAGRIARELARMVEREGAKTLRELRG
jgi:dihydroorotate dehydrogenase